MRQHLILPMDLTQKTTIIKDEQTAKLLIDKFFKYNPEKGSNSDIEYIDVMAAFQKRKELQLLPSIEINDEEDLVTWTVYDVMSNYVNGNIVLISFYSSETDWSTNASQYKDFFDSMNYFLGKRIKMLIAHIPFDNRPANTLLLSGIIIL